MGMKCLLQFKHTIISLQQIFHHNWTIENAPINYSNYLQKSIDLKEHKKFILKHTILYIHCIDLLMWSPTKLGFLFYNVFYNLLQFFKDSVEINKKGKDKTALL